MSRLSPHATAWIFAFLGCILCSLPTSGQEEQSVAVTNFPEVQTVDGTLSVDGPIVQTTLLELTAAVVAPVGQQETTALVLAGTLDTSGFATATLSLAGEVTADFFDAGEIGVLLVPDVPLALAAFEDGAALLSLTVTASADPGSNSYFGATQPTVPLAFPAYRVYFFNSTDRAVQASLFAYLGN